MKIEPNIDYGQYVGHKYYDLNNNIMCVLGINAAIKLTNFPHQYSHIRLAKFNLNELVKVKVSPCDSWEITSIAYSPKHNDFTYDVNSTLFNLEEKDLEPLTNSNQSYRTYALKDNEKIEASHDLVKTNSCNHENTKIVRMIYTSYKVCVDCGEDLGNV